MRIEAPTATDEIGRKRGPSRRSRRRGIRLALGSVPAWLVLLAGTSLAQTAEEVREAMSAARGEPSGELVELEGACRDFGLQARFSLTFGPEGRFHRRVTGPLGETAVGDGERLWSTQWNHPVRELHFGERDQEAVSALLLGGAWPARGDGLRVSSVGSTGDDGLRLELALEDRPLRASLTVDRSTWLPRALTLGSGALVTEITYSEWRAVDGIMLPHQIVASDPGGTERTYRVERAAASAPMDPERFRPPVARGGDTRYGPPEDAVVESRRAPTGHLLVHPELEHEDAGWFLLDSGAGALCIDPTVAQELALETFGEVTAVGVGGAVVSEFHRGSSFVLGQLEVIDPIYVGLDLSFLSPVMGVKVAGVCGYDVFARAVVEVDYEEPSIAVHDPRGFALDSGSAWQELLLDARLPTVECRFEGDRSGRFKIDTGAGDTVTFHTPAVDRLELLEGRDVSSGTSGGVGGFVPTQVGELDWFELGGLRFERPQVTFSRAEEGAFEDAYTLGNLGASFLKPFRIVFDYGAGRISFQRVREVRN